MRTRRPNESGVVLLLVLIVGSILYVIIGQLSWSTALDGALARNHLLDAQARCDLRSAAALFKAVVEQEGTNRFTYELPTGTVTMAWEVESGKFNLNNLRRERYPQAGEQLDRLFRLLEDRGGISVLGLGARIADLVTGGERPLGSLGELMQIDEVTEEVLAELARYLTVHSDGRINYEHAPPEIMVCLSEGLTPSMIEPLKKRLADPKAPVNNQVAFHARNVGRYVSDESRAWLGRLTLGGGRVGRTLEVALVARQGRLRTVLFNEKEQRDETEER